MDNDPLDNVKQSVSKRKDDDTCENQMVSMQNAGLISSESITQRINKPAM